MPLYTLNTTIKAVVLTAIPTSEIHEMTLMTVFCLREKK